MKTTNKPKKGRSLGPRFDTIQQAAGALGVSPGLLRGAKAQGCGAFRHGKVYLYPLAAWALAGGKDCAPLDLNAERARLAKEQADKLALKNSVTRGELREWGEVVAYVSGLLGPMRDRILAVESYAARANPDAPEVARAALQSWIDDTLRVMAQLTKGEGQ